MSFCSTDYDESDYEDALDDFNDGFENFFQQDVTSEDGSLDDECTYEYGDSEMDDAFNQAQDMFFEEKEKSNLSDSNYGPRFELDFHDELELDEEEDSASNKQSSNPAKSRSLHGDHFDICKKLKELSAECKAFRVAQRSVNSTKVKVSSQVAVIPISSPLVIAPICSPQPSLEISVTLTIDSSTISNLPTDEVSPHVPHDNLEFPCLAQCIIVDVSLSAVDAESKVEEAILDLVVPVDGYKKEEASLDPIHVPPSVEQSFSFSIIPTTQTFMDLFHNCTLHQFELGRDPPRVLNVGDSKSRFRLEVQSKTLRLLENKKLPWTHYISYRQLANLPYVQLFQ